MLALGKNLGSNVGPKSLNAITGSIFHGEHIGVPSRASIKLKKARSYIIGSYSEIRSIGLGLVGCGGGERNRDSLNFYFGRHPAFPLKVLDCF